MIDEIIPPKKPYIIKDIEQNDDMYLIAWREYVDTIAIARAQFGTVVLEILDKESYRTEKMVTMDAYLSYFRDERVQDLLQDVTGINLKEGDKE